jgi:regulator of protease activity HflC (stomatin/prohibitin superfamily)
VQEALKQVTAKYTAEALVQKREIVREETRNLIRQAIGEQIDVVDFNLINIDLSDQLEQAIEAKMVQQQTSLKKEYELASERKEAEIVAVKAEAEAKAVKIRGEAIATNPLVLQLEIIKKWNGISPSVVVLGKDGNAANVILPITPTAEQKAQ